MSSDDDNDDYDDNDDDDEEDDMEENSDNDSGISGGEESEEEEEEEEDDDDDAIAEEADANAQQQMLPSPPGSGPGSGMRLRSGRKKRRRRSADGKSAASASAAAAGTPRRRAAAAAAAAAMSAARSRPTTRTTPSRKNAAAAAAAASSAKKRKRGTTAAARKARKTVRIVGVGGGGDEYESDSSSEGSRGSEVGEQRQKPRANGGKSKSGRKPAAKRRRRGDADEDEGDDEEEMEEIAAATETQPLRTEQNDLRSREATREQQVQDRLESNRTLLATVRGQRLVHQEREGAEDDPAPPPAFLSPPADRAALAEAAGADSELDEDGGGTDGDTSPLHSVSLKLPPRTARKAQAQASSRASRRPSRNGRSGGATGAHLSGRKDPVAAEAAATSGRTDPVAAEAEADDEEAESVEGAAPVARPGLLRRASSGVAAHLWKFTDTIRPTVRPGVGRVMVPEAERPTPEQARGAEGSGETAQLGAPATSAAASVAQRRRGLRQHPVFWLLAWLVLHTVVAMLSGGVVVRPLWSSLPETSQRRLHFYRSLMGQFIPNGGGTTSGKVIIPDDAALEGEDDDDNDEEESPLEPEVVEKVVEEIVYEDEPDDDLYQSELQLRKDAAIASQRQKDQEAADASSAAALAAHEARKKQRDETIRTKKKEQAAAEADVEVLRNLRTAVEIRNKEAKSVANRVDTQVKSYEELVAEGDDAVAARYKKLQAWEEALEKAEHAIQKLEDGMAGAASNGSAVNLAEALNVLKTASVLPVMPSLLDPRTVTIPGEACNGMEYVPIGDAVAELDDSAISTSSTIARRQAEEDAEDAPIQMEDLEQAKKDLVQLADSTADTIISDDGIVNAVRHWLNKEIKNAGLDLTAKLDDDKEEDVRTLNNEQPAQADGEEDTDGLSAQAVKQIISHRLGLDIADGDGMFDFASIRSGASVVLTGPRRTSPSLKDNLPLLNRLLASAKLRFYGHPPEAALNPTYPPNALGQCWAFEAAKGPTLDDDTDNAVGRYATFTINLAEPVQIKSVTMEHAPRDLTPTPGTAIRDFRVIGYEGSDAKGAPIPLGSFRYEIDGPRTLQEFEVESEEGGDLSSLTSVTLAIDSNWGADYSCLYRFRVHGDRPVPLPTSSVHSSCEE